MARTVKASIVVMSHLSDAQALIGVQHFFGVNDCINFAKYIILELGGNLDQEIDANAMFQKYKGKVPELG